jgi:hypothetical protein
MDISTTITENIMDIPQKTENGANGMHIFKKNEINI